MAVCSSVWQCVWQCAAVCVAVCVSSCVWQCAAVCVAVCVWLTGMGAAVCAAAAVCPVCRWELGFSLLTVLYLIEEFKDLVQSLWAKRHHVGDIGALVPGEGLPAAVCVCSCEWRGLCVWGVGTAVRDTAQAQSSTLSI
jgi:hypothetical protein